ncbi:SPFH domain-containing protein [Mycoplasmopsis pulmonis]|uniref:SPFH domain-containing protein n=1 Tax=Mycoplasmopsis pulmonis TaxID=2107 RepID=UPI002ACE03B2|nr:SPFH domain-containing protein [Mycoplasmopsis pulmonis]MDZ7293758.1 SPFH/Band 7/PHB domain protein [Mycoplasmopsis pulmonis]
MPWYIILLIVLGVIFLFCLVLVLPFSLKIVSQTEFIIVERLGTYRKTLTNGIHFIIPIIDIPRSRGNFKEQVLDFKPQDVITKDNAIVKVDSVIFFQITDAKLYTYGAEYPIKALENLSYTTLRNLLGEFELDELLTSRDIVNAKLTTTIDLASDAWGIKVHRVELKTIDPPADIKNAMEKQLRAEREKRANILEAQGQREAAILEAQGQREAAILAAQGEKEAAILRAQGQREAAILEAEGQKKSIYLLNSSDISKEVLTWKSIEQLGRIADGKATKIIIPPSLQNLAGSMASVAEFFDIKDKKNDE